MLYSVTGVYRNGRVEFTESPGEILEVTHVIVTFLDPEVIDLRERGIDQKAAARLRDSLATFAEDWDDPSMSVYDNYDAAKSNL